MGLLIASTVIFAWLGHLVWLLAFAEVSFTSPMLLVHIAVQTYLYTGLFITAHDAMHGLVSPNRAINNGVGHLATRFFAALSYSRLLEKHKLHHRFPGEAGDPDYCTTSQNFWRWWFSFLKNYVSVWQFVIFAVVFNILQIWVDQLNLIFFWILPSVLATFQLFYFGTYRPHRLPHTDTMLPHNSRTQKGPHWWAMLSCYFFGYHFEHHESPRTPWWKLYQIKNQRV
ncbi:MAG: fatty acid desaturase [Prolixibacteraceae bacterium]|nr:fatty acid desaturase [Prolixibacteraceae bacterium]